MADQALMSDADRAAAGAALADHALGILRMGSLATRQLRDQAMRAAFLVAQEGLERMELGGPTSPAFEAACDLLCSLQRLDGEMARALGQLEPQAAELIAGESMAERGRIEGAQH